MVIVFNPCIVERSQIDRVHSYGIRNVKRIKIGIKHGINHAG